MGLLLDTPLLEPPRAGIQGVLYPPTRLALPCPVLRLIQELGQETTRSLLLRRGWAGGFSLTSLI